MNLSRMMVCVTMGLLAAGMALAQEGTAPAGNALWPYQLENYGAYAASGRNAGKSAVMAWAPPGAKHIRALLVVAMNTDSLGFAEHPAFRKVAEKQEMGIVYMRTGDEPEVQGILDALAEKTGIPEFRHAPWIPFGKSSRSMFPILMEWKHPERTIAGISYHAATPNWPPEPVARLAGQTILHVNVNGETEWGGTWYVHVRPSLLNYRAKQGWLAHQVVSWGVGHGDYPDETSGKNNPTPRQVRVNIWDYLAMYVDKAIDLRVPKDRYATNGPVTLKQVDENSGYLIDPFAVEGLFRKPAFPLTDSPEGYVAGQTDDSSTNGFLAIPPAANYVVPNGVPVVRPEIGRSPSAWLITQGMPFALKNDPMTGLGTLAQLRPQPGDQVMVDDVAATFSPIAPKQVGRNGGIALGGLKKSSAFTLLAYTVLDVAETTRLKVRAPFTVAGRLQVVLNGVPVEHRQVVELQKGRYPMLVALRLSGVDWGAVEPCFDTVTDDEVKQARAYQVDKERQQAEQAKILAAPARNASAYIYKAADVPQAQRGRMFWVADREQAEAWFKLHAIKEQRFDLP